MDQHQYFLKQAIATAQRARENGNHPFGAILVDATGRVIAIAENTVVTAHDATQHAEINVIRVASSLGEDLKTATIYTSTEPCVMCCGAIHWAGIPRVVYGCSAAALGMMAQSTDFLVPCREIFARTTQPRVEVVGPLLEEDAIVVHHKFWS